MRTDDCTPASILGRLAKAEDFLEAADALLTLEESSESVIITNYVHAGIAASDVICCKKLGRHAKGQNHDEAKKLLAQVDNALSTSLGTLLNMKTEAGYGASGRLTVAKLRGPGYCSGTTLRVVKGSTSRDR